MALDFDAIRRDFPIGKIIGAAVKLRKSGTNLVGCCPFHADKSPSFVVYGKDERYHCFGCGADGDVIDFVAATQHTDIAGAVASLTGGDAPRLTDEDREKRRREIERQEARQQIRQEAATLDARARWERALPINGVGNGYLTRKNVAPYGTRREGDNLIVPIYGSDGLILSLQSIPPEAGGKKLFHAGAPVTGGTFTLGDTETGPVVISEGFATGATVQAASGFLVVVGFSKKALKRTAQIAASRYPGRPIIIAADTNGVDDAKEAAGAVGGAVIIPELMGAEGSDFNDQAAQYGIDDVASMFFDARSALDAAPAAPPKKLVRATPFAWRDSADIPKREWLYGKHLLRKFVSVDVAAGGVGKSSLKIGEAVAMASDRDIYGKGLPEGALSVWLWNLEDPHEEMERRIHATCQRFRITPEELAGRLYVDSGRDQPLIIANETPNGAVIARPVVDALIAEMQERKIDVLIVDPFISSHAVSENDNNAIDLVAREWNFIAERTGAAINLVHHVRKGNGTEATADSARGASALVGKARSVLVYNRMTEAEASRLNVEIEDRKFLFRVDNDKANLAPPDATDWYRMNSVELANGDHIGVACSWTPPDAFENITTAHLMRVQRAVADGKWRFDSQAKAWVGHAISSIVSLDTDLKNDRARIKTLIKGWIDEGVLEKVLDLDEKRMEKDFVVVGRWVSE